MTRRAAAAIAVAWLLVSPLARGFAEDLSHVSDEEIAVEIAARTDDMERTEQRIASMERELARSLVLAEEARFELDETERRAAANAALLYRLSRHGAALRYLLSSGDATGFLKRVHVLRSLVFVGLEARRAAGNRLNEATAASGDLERELALAREMLSSLVEARADLIAERDRRSVDKPPVR